jgi:hypothetical protein
MNQHRLIVKLTRAEADWIIAKGTRFADWKAKR